MNLIVFSLRAFLLVYVPVVYRSPSYIVVSKPSGVPMHGEDSLLQIVREQEQLGRGSCHLVHRLDTPTSGLVILPTSSESAGKVRFLEGFDAPFTHFHFLISPPLCA